MRPRSLSSSFSSAQKLAVDVEGSLGGLIDMSRIDDGEVENIDLGAELYAALFSSLVAQLTLSLIIIELDSIHSRIGYGLNSVWQQD